MACTRGSLALGIANLASGPVTRGFAPQQGGRLVKILADVGEVLDTSYWKCLQYQGPNCIDSVAVDPESTWNFIHIDTLADRIVHLQINKDFKDYLNFATSPDHSFWDLVPFWDTNGWVCTNWVVDTSVNPPETLGCGSYERTSTPPWDSIDVVLDTLVVLDTNEVNIYNGTLVTLVPQTYVCGDLNGDNVVGNVLDLTFIIDRIFRGGPAASPPQRADMNCDGTNGNILDLTVIVDRIFRGGPPVCTSGACN